jgi:hypothetical protein
MIAKMLPIFDFNILFCVQGAKSRRSHRHINTNFLLFSNIVYFEITIVAK